MQKFSSADGIVLPDDQGIWFVVERGVRQHPNRVALGRLDGSNVAAGGAGGGAGASDAAETVLDVTYREFADQVRVVAVELLAAGVEHGDRVAVMGRTSYAWALVGFAALSVGAVVVPVYPTASAAQVRHLVSDSGAGWGFAETDDQQSLLTEAGAASLRRPVWRLGVVDQWTAAAPAPVAGTPTDGAAADRRRADDETFAQRVSKVRADDLAMIIYTSGTTGMPKGVMLTHRNMYASSAGTVEQTGRLFRIAEDGAQATTVMCLPLSHVFGQTILLSCLYAGTRTVLLPGVPDLLPAMPTVRPTFLALVPYALEKIRKRVGTMGHDDVVRAFGGRLTAVISGGASLDDTTAAYFGGLGVDVLNCYGLTEAATAVTVNAPATNRAGTVGRPIPGTTVAIAGDGEVLVRGLNVSPGYWSASERAVGRDATGTSESRWLRTGDVGHLDSDGYLVVTGRRKEILVTSGGKNVAPTPLEDRVRLHPLVSNCMVVGEARPFVAALVTTDAAALATWAAANDVPLDRQADSDGAGWWSHPRLLAEVQLAVDDANSMVSRAESIRKFCLLDIDFTVERGHLTPSMKLRRTAIEADFADTIDSLYQ